MRKHHSYVINATTNTDHEQTIIVIKQMTSSITNVTLWGHCHTVGNIIINRWQVASLMSHGGHCHTVGNIIVNRWQVASLMSHGGHCHTVGDIIVNSWFKFHSIKNRHAEGFIVPSSYNWPKSTPQSINQFI